MRTCLIRKAFLATPVIEFPARTFATSSNLCSAVQSRFAEPCFNPSTPRSSNAFTQALTWSKKVLLLLPIGARSRLPSLYLRTQPSLNFQSYFMKNTPFLVLSRIRGTFQLARPAFSYFKYRNRLSCISSISINQSLKKGLEIS